MPPTDRATLVDSAAAGGGDQSRILLATNSVARRRHSNWVCVLAGPVPVSVCHVGPWRTVEWSGAASRRRRQIDIISAAHATDSPERAIHARHTISRHITVDNTAIVHRTHPH